MIDFTDWRMKFIELRYASEEKSKAWMWAVALLVWCVWLCFVPDPRPLGAPQWAVQAVRSTAGVSEHSARAIATLVLRASGLSLIGVFLALSLSSYSLRYAAPIVLVGTPLIALLCQWINYGYFPVWLQLQLGFVSAIFGALGGLALCRSWLAGGVLGVLLVSLYVWGSSTGITDDLAEQARITGECILDQADDIPSGDEGFAKLLELAFQFAEDNSHGSGAIESNRAAILALGVIVGEERVASVAKRSVNIQRKEVLDALRSRITVRQRNDLARHFWVSAALMTLSDENRSLVIGVGKEMMDATEGGSGFSFVDLTADHAGNLFAVAAKKTPASARALQARIRAGVHIDDFFPTIDGLPEGLTRDEFQTQYGGLGGTETLRLMREIESRLANCEGLKPTE